MRRLFLRLWVTSALLCIGALLLEDYLVWEVMTAADVEGDDAYLAGGVLLARDWVDEVRREERDGVVEELEALFELPTEILPIDSVPTGLREQLAGGTPAAFRDGLVDFEWFVPLEDGREALHFGPHTWEEGTPTWALDLILVALLITLTLGLALWSAIAPFDRQRRALEEAAGAIAGGDYTARVGPGQAAVDSVAAAFNTMAARTEDLITAQRHLLHAVSHELRTPIARLRLGIHLLNTEDGEARDRKEDELDADIQELDDLVDELLTYARFDAKAAEPGGSCEAVALVQERIGRLASTAAHAEISLVCEVAEGADRVALGVSALARAFENLLTNAMRHADRRVRVTVAPDDNGVGLQIAVEDDGPGIPEVDRARALEPFTRLDEAVGAGHGLGLAIVTRICERSGGRLILGESALGGARCALWLPRA